MSRKVEELLILTKTYPSPSTKHRETTCVAAITREGEMRRLFPVPYRFLTGASQFKKWEWIRASLATTTADQRPESRRIDVDSIELLGERVGTDDSWFERLRIIEPHVLEDFYSLEARRKASGETLGFIRPKGISAFEITPAKPPSWDDADYQKLAQDGLFDTAEMRNRVVLRKVPFDYHYKYISGENVYRHKVIDWEAGALYWNCLHSYGEEGWEEKFRYKFDAEFQKKDLLFLMGTIHRFPDRWLIVGLIYPPKRQPAPATEQLGLGLDQLGG
jgi:hypothetical protein